MAEPTAALTALSWLSGALSVLLGFGAKSLSDYYQHKYTLERERESRDATRRDQLAERRAEFQRQTLLELQDAVFDLMRTTGAMHHQDEMAYRQTAKWQKQPYGEELNEKDSLAMRRCAMLSVRVSDASLRELVQKLRNFAAQATVSVSRDHSNSAVQNMADVFEQVQGRVGELLRTLDDDEQSALTPKTAKAVSSGY